MAEGTGVGSIFLDLVVRDTIEKQIRDIAAKGEEIAQQAFSGMEKAAERAVENAASCAGKLADIAAEAAARSAEKMTKQAEKAAESASKAAEKVVQPAQKAAETAAQSAGKAAEQAKDAVLTTSESVSSQVAEATEKSAALVGEAVSAAAENAASNAESCAVKMAEDAQRAAESVAQAALAVTTSTAQTASTAAAKSSESSKRASQAAVDSVSQATQAITKEAAVISEQVGSAVEKSMDKGVAKLQTDLKKLEDQLSALDMEKEIQIRADTAVFEETVKKLNAKIKDLKAQIAALGEGPAAKEKKSSLKAQLYTARNQRNIAQEMLDQQRDLAEARASAKVKAQQEKLYAQVESARQRLTVAVTAAAEKQSAAEVTQIQKTAQAAEAAAVKRQAEARQAHTTTAPPPAVDQTAPVAQLSVWQKLTGAASRFGNITSGAFSRLTGTAGSFAKLALKGVTRLGGAVIRLSKNLLVSNKRLATAGSTARMFGSRMREIVSGALIFNGIGLAVRNMVSHFTTAISSTNEMKTALANLKGAAANAASPIIQILTPALTALANSAATVFSYVSQLLTLLTGKVSSAAATATKSSEKAAGAAKKAARSLAGFDEIQRLDGNTDDSGGGGGSDTVEPNYDFQGKSPFLDSIMAAIKAGQWEQVGALIAQKLNSTLAAVPWHDIQNKVKTWTQNLVDTINGFVHKLDWGLLGKSLGEGFNTWLLAIDTFFQGIDWAGLGTGVAKGLNGLFDTVDWAMLGRVLSDKFMALAELLHGFVQAFNFADFGSNLAEMLMAALKNIDWVQLASDLSAGIVGLFDAANAFAAGLDWAWLGSTLYDCIIAIDWGGMFAGLLELLTTLAVGLLVSLGAGLFQAFQDLGKTISGYFTDVGENGIQGFLDGMDKLLLDISTWLYDHLVKPVIDGVKNALGIHSPSTVFAEIGTNLIMGLLEGIESVWNKISEFFVDAFESLKKSLASIWEDGIVPMIKGAINGIIGAINGMISGIVSGMNTVIRAMNKLKFDIPDWVPALGGKTFGFNIATITAPQIPMLAGGGVITQPTLAMMGEYSGARNNPEIVAPQSIMAETVAEVMEDVIASSVAGFEAVVAVLREILEAVLGIEIGDDVIGQAVARYNRKMAVVKGGT